MKKIGDLAAVVPTPATPNVLLDTAAWIELFQRFGTRLPQDFVQFHRRYGDGWFASLILR